MYSALVLTTVPFSHAKADEHDTAHVSTNVHCRQHAPQIDKPQEAAIDVVNLSSNGKVGAGDVAGSSSALPFDQLHMVRA